ncbi:hypothetical protein HYT55_05450 [Candidatus Woesearchaeota archaeon]|nr:hypothetical protein [Candidatus Woesearchaeota archaeon]
MKQKQNLEDAIKEKVVSLLEETLGKHLGIVVPQLETDITDRLSQSRTAIYIPHHLPFKVAKRKFKEHLLRWELRAHFGNVSLVARTLGIDRRSIHRAIHDYGISLDRDKNSDETPSIREEIGETIRKTLDQYKDIFHPIKMEKLYANVPALSQDIAQVLPPLHLRWKEAEAEFECQFLTDALRRNEHNFLRTARDIGLRPETLSRKIRRLRLG